jgi:hypothetical protein
MTAADVVVATGFPSRMLRKGYPSHEHHWRDVWGDDIVGAWRRSKVSAKNIGEL